jgi:hypothetical protein
VPHKNVRAHGVVIRTVINNFTFDGATKDPMQKAVRDALIAFMALGSSAFLETSISNIPSINLLSFYLGASARVPLRTTLYAGYALTRVPRYRPI